MAAFAHACAVGSRPTASSWWCGEQPCGWTALMGCLLHKLVCSVSYAGAEHLVLSLYRCYDADLGAIGNKLHRIPKVSKVCLRCVSGTWMKTHTCCHACVLLLSKEGAATTTASSATYCQARPWTQTYPCCKPCRAHGLDTCSLGLGRVFNHRFSRREICPPKSHRDEQSMQIHHCRLSTLRQVRSTCRRKLAGNRNHFSTMGPAVGCRS
ncbi:hypothetical protein J3E69DRAFT_71155 [Trichoderma sp. SZMC 28015]